MSDLGLTHVALVVKDLDASIAFYAKYGGMSVVQRRPGHREGGGVAWISDRTRPFVIVLIQSPGLEDTPLGPVGHLGVAVADRGEVDRLAAEARRDGVLRKEPTDSGPPVGYWTYLADPDGNILELSYGQDVALAVEGAEK
ncbi:MAG: VOC family protein [Alphaproteobacteria bacterium]|nr:VOC family protein [Alphaproteobacteria bacterium]MDE2110068.1 VOC family protein [Alphaproteobacteria bacterium]MDE2492999.1 VOC family protein [Alphaproteobacteria bacterium]